MKAKYDKNCSYCYNGLCKGRLICFQSPCTCDSCNTRFKELQQEKPPVPFGLRRAEIIANKRSKA